MAQTFVVTVVELSTKASHTAPSPGYDCGVARTAVVEESPEKVTVSTLAHVLVAS